jgi:hypothetical protein
MGPTLVAREDRGEIVGGQPGWLSHEYPHPGCFAKRGCKRLKTKGGRAGKEAKESGKRRQSADSKRVERKSATQKALSSEHRDHSGVHTPGVLHGCENKGFAGKGIRKFMKIKRCGGGQAERGICKLVILKGRRNSRQRARRTWRFGGGKEPRRWEAIFTLYDSTAVIA